MLAQLEQFKKDLETASTALEQSAANHNALVGQKKTLEYVIAKLKDDLAKAEEVASGAEIVVENAVN